MSLLEDAAILVVDDEKEICDSLQKVLTKEGARVFVAASGNDALAILKSDRVDLVLTDLRMPTMDGMQLLEEIKALNPEIQVIVLTAFGSIENAVEAMRKGAYDFITKPVKRVSVLKTIEKALELQELARENRYLRCELAGHARQNRLVGTSPTMREVQNWIKRVAPINSTILITGESGTGKELVAREIHSQSPRSARPFVAINCAAIPEMLIESELFGHTRGSFTGAIRDKEGLFLTAAKGTLFLDEISSIPLTLQAKLLRSIEEKEILPVGSTRPISVDARIIAASNRDLNKAVEEGAFREDLFYRLNVVCIEIPPLRNRLEDIEQLVHYFIERHNLQLNKNVTEVVPEVIQILKDWPWRGNVRELDNVIERALILCEDSQLRPEHLPKTLLDSIPDKAAVTRLKEAVHFFERQHILTVLRQVNNDKLKAAELLGLSQSSLYRKLSELSIPTFM